MPLQVIVTIIVNDERAANVSYLGFNKIFDAVSQHSHGQAAKIGTREQYDGLKTG